MTVSLTRPADAGDAHPAQPATHKPATGFYRHDLDGLRGIAIALVAMFHVWFGRVSGGVDVFLALSGFFFGEQWLRAALNPASSLSPLPEVVRLVRRLLPALVVVLAGCAVLTILIQPETRWEPFADQSLASLGYYQNWELASTVADYLRAGESVSPLQHIWSMSVQGQFYIAFLALVFGFAFLLRRRLGDRLRTAFVVLLTALAAASFGYAIFAHQASQATAYYNSFARAWELLLGALVGALVPYVRWPMWLRTTAATIALAAVLSCGALIDGVKQFPGPWALVPVGAALLFILAGANLQAGPTTVLGSVVGLLGVTLTATAFTWREHVNVERASGKELSGLSSSDYPGARALVKHLRVPRLRMRPTVLEAQTDYPPSTRDGCISDFKNTDVITCSYGDTSATRTIALAGGSHAEHWLTALDLLGRRHHFKVTTYLKMGCPLSTEKMPLVMGNNDLYPECRDWVPKAMDRVVADHPDFVFTTSTRPWNIKPGDVMPGTYAGIWQRFADNNIPILAMRDTPWLVKDGQPFNPSDCLAKGGDAVSCGVKRSDVLADRNPTLDWVEQFPMLKPLDMSDAVCRADICPAVEGNVLVYHDAHHLSATYMRTMTSELGRQVGPATGWW